MSFYKQAAGVCVFVAAFSASAALAIFYGFISVPQFGAVERPAIARLAHVDGDNNNTSAASEVPLAARFVTLDFERRRSYTTLELTREQHQPAPGKLRVWTYFFTPEGAQRGEVWTAAPVELTRPFAAAGTIRLDTEAACSFCDDAQAPRSGYYARVFVTTDARPPFNRRADNFDFDIRTASAVVVQAASSSRPR